MLLEGMEEDEQREQEATFTTIKGEISMKVDGMVGASQTSDKIIMEKGDKMEIINRVEVGIIVHLVFRISPEEEIIIDITATTTQLNTTMHLLIGAKVVEAAFIHIGSQIIAATIISKETNTTAIRPTRTDTQAPVTNSTTAITVTIDMVRTILTIKIHR
jgi:hypothetical protein